MSAPVFGRPDAAMEHRVTFAVAGPAEAKEQLQPLLKSMSRGILDLGEQPQLANVMKITGDGSPAEALDNHASAGELGSGLKRWRGMQARRSSMQGCTCCSGCRQDKRNRS